MTESCHVGKVVQHQARTHHLPIEQCIRSQSIIINHIGRSPFLFPIEGTQHNVRINVFFATNDLGFDHVQV